MTKSVPPETLFSIRLGVGAGLAASVVYPVLIFLPLPDIATAALAAAWGPLLAVASVGLGRLLQAERRSMVTHLGVLFNVVAGALVTAMLLVQMAVREQASGERIGAELVGVWLGLDVAWDVYIGLGTALLALAMFRHPRFRAYFAAPGVAVAVLLLVLNLMTFPTPPGEAGLFDAGPLVGAWYLAVSIQAWRSLGWAATALGVAGERVP